MMKKEIRGILSVLALILFSTGMYGQSALLDNVDYEDGNCQSEDFSCPKERLAVSDHLAGRYSAGEKWLDESSDIIEAEIDTIRRLSVDLILAKQPQEIQNIKHRISLAKQKVYELATPVRKVFSEVTQKMTQNESDQEYMKYYRYCFKLGNENYMRHYDICGMQKLGEKFYKMSVQKNGQKYHDQAMYYLDMLDKYRNYDKYISSRLAPFRDINDRLMGISYKAVIGTPTFWLDQLSGPFNRYAYSVNRYLQIFENLETKMSEMMDKKTRKARIALEISQVNAHLKQHQEMLASIDNQIKNKQEKIAGSKKERLRTIERLGSLYNTTTPKHAMDFISSESVRYDQKRLINLSDKAFKVPGTARYLQITANRRVLYKANGFWRKNRIDYPDLLGEFATTNGYIGTYLSYGDIPKKNAPIGALLANMNGGAKIEVGAGGPVALADAFRGQTFGLMVNDYQPGLSRTDCPNPLASDKRCFSLSGGAVTFTAKYFSDTGESFPKILAYLKANLDEIVSKNVNTADPFNKVREEVLVGIRDHTDNIGPFLPIINHALSIKLMEKKIHDLELSLDGMFADKKIILSKAQSAKQSIAELEQVLASVEKDANKIEAIVKNYYQRKFALERLVLYSSLREFSQDLNLYIDSLIYRNPGDKKSYKKFLMVQKMVSTFLSSSRQMRMEEGLVTRSVEDVRSSLCEPFIPVASQVSNLCNEFSDQIELEEIKQAISRFFVGQDRKWRFPREYGDKDLLHCQIHLGAPTGKGRQYLKEQFGVDYIQRLIFNETGRSEFYFAKDFDSPQFSQDNACSFVSANLREQCRNDRASAEAYLEELQGYYELPFQTINGLLQPQANNMDCNFTREQVQGIANPLMLGAAVEWTANLSEKLFSKNISSAILQKSNSSWFDRLDENGNANTIFSKISDLPNRHSNQVERAVRLMETEYLKDGTIDGSNCAAYNAPHCALKMLGRSLVKPKGNDVYNFKTSYLNSWFHNDWVLRIPIYSGSDMKSYNRLMLEKLNDLKLHFYFIAETEGQK